MSGCGVPKRLLLVIRFFAPTINIRVFISQFSVSVLRDIGCFRTLIDGGNLICLHTTRILVDIQLFAVIGTETGVRPVAKVRDENWVERWAWFAGLNTEMIVPARRPVHPKL